MSNRLLEQFNSTIQSEWLCETHIEEYAPLNHREVFELAYHTCNTVSSRNISMKLSQSENKGGSMAILYSSKGKTFVSIEALEENLKIAMYSADQACSDKINGDIKPKLTARKVSYAAKEKDVKTQILKTVLVQRKLDECANLVMLKDIARKVYFAIGDARESAAVVPMFMGAEGASLVQLALNKWMAAAQRLPQEEKFPDSHVGGILKNLLQIKKWVLNLVTTMIE